MKRAMLIAVPVLVVAYAVMPFAAGACALGERRGPWIYPEGYHELLYILGYEARFGEKPRVSIGRGRPWFYGMAAPPVPKPKAFEEAERYHL